MANNIGQDIQEALKSPYPKIIPTNNLGLKRKNGLLYGDWLGALWLLAETQTDEPKKMKEVWINQFLFRELPHRKDWWFPKKPEWIGEFKTKDYLLNEIKTKSHSIFSFSCLMYDITYQAWEENKNSSNPIWYVGEFLKLNNIEYQNNHQSFLEFYEQSEKYVVRD